MPARTDDRGVSEVVGFILLFGMLAISFTVYQGIVVPDQNRQAEFQHNQEVQGDMQELRNAILRTAATGSGEAVSVTLGATYPGRTIAQNLGVSAGTVETVDTGGGVRVQHVRATDRETRDYVDGSLGPFESRSIQYTPVYSFYGEAPRTIYENTLAYNQFSSTNLTLTDQLVVDGRRITVVAVDGDLQRSSRGTVSISTEAISTSSTRVAVRNTTGERVTLRVPTTLSAAAWDELLEEERAANGGHIEDVVQSGPDEVTLVLAQNTVYELRMAKIGIGGATTDEPPKYAVAVEGDEASVPEGGSIKLVAEVRDRFSNPTSNATTTASVTGPGSLVSAEGVTDSAGRSSFVYEAPADVSSTQDVDVEVSFDGDGTANESVTFDLRVLDNGGPGGASPSNYDVFWDTSAIESQQGVESCSGDTCTYDLSDDPNSNLPLSAGTSPALSGVFVDFSTNDSGIVTQLNPSEAVTDGSGSTSTTASIGTTGTVAVFASATEDSDKLVLDVIDSGGGGGGAPVPQIDRRVDDLSHGDQDRPRYITSYSVSDTNASFQRVSVVYANQDDPSADAVVNGSSVRGALRYDNGYGVDDDYEIRVRVIYEDGGGDDYVAAEEVVTDTADAQNPTGNDDLSAGGSPAFQSISVTDTSNGGQGPRYRFNYNVAPAGDFQQVEAYVVGLGVGGSASQTSVSSNTQLTVSPSYGYTTQFKVAALVVDSDGAVVDARTYTDTADGSGP